MWIRQSFREDGQPSSPVSAEEQTLEGPLHEGVYAGQCLTRQPLHVGMYTFAQALLLFSKYDLFSPLAFLPPREP